MSEFIDYRRAVTEDELVAEFAARGVTRGHRTGLAVPFRYRGADPADWSADVSGPVLDWEQDPSSVGLWLKGAPSRGKTRMGWMLAQRAHDRGDSVLVTSVPELLESTRGLARDTLLPEARDVNLLVLDDFGRQVLNGRDIGVLTDLLGTRNGWAPQRRTVYTANSAPTSDSQLRAEYDAASIADRLLVTANRPLWERVNESLTVLTVNGAGHRAGTSTR